AAEHRWLHVAPPLEPTAVHTRVAVIGSGSTAPPLAAAVALGLKANARARAAVVALWRPPGLDGPPPGPAAPAFPGAAPLAGRLTRRGLTPAARGRLLLVL